MKPEEKLLIVRVMQNVNVIESDKLSEVLVAVSHEISESERMSIIRIALEVAKGIQDVVTVMTLCRYWKNPS